MSNANTSPKAASMISFETPEGAAATTVAPCAAAGAAGGI